MSQLTQRAGAIAARVERKPVGSLMLVLTVVGIIISAVRLWWDCRHNYGNPHEMMGQMGMLAKWRLRGEVWRALDRQGLDTAMATELRDQVVNELATMSVAETEGLVGEVAAMEGLR